MFLIAYILNYLFLIYFTNYFRQANINITKKLLLFTFYIIICTGFRTILKLCGMYLDRYKNKSCSMYFIGEFLGLMFYYVFYRVLFESIHNIPDFLALQVLHITSEWILYVFRATQWYYNTRESLVTTLFTHYYYHYYYCSRSCCPCCCVSQSQEQEQPRTTSYRDWQQFIALDFGIRIVVFIASAIGFLMLLTTIQYVPYLRTTNALSISHTNYLCTIELISLAVGIEVINAMIINYGYFVRHGLHVFEELRNCFALRQFAMIVALLGSVMFINPVFAYTTKEFYH